VQRLNRDADGRALAGLARQPCAVPCCTPSEPFPAAPGAGIVIELMVEQWSQPDGRTRYLWSVWENGKRIGMGEGAPSPEAAERDGRQWCLQTVDRPPDRVTKL